jgi:molybdopterin synthase catalytic subunit
MSFLTQAPIVAEALARELEEPAHGGLCSFVGLVRDHHQGRSVLRLEYSAYNPMAERVIAEIIDEARARWPAQLAVRHRLGELAVGDTAVAVVAASAHRGPAFEACRYVIEELKQRVPIWKKEFYTDGTVVWVDPTAARSGVVPAERA